MVKLLKLVPFDSADVKNVQHLQEVFQNTFAFLLLGDGLLSYF